MVIQSKQARGVVTPVDCGREQRESEEQLNGLNHSQRPMTSTDA
jgi:hypothetical protein